MKTIFLLLCCCIAFCQVYAGDELLIPAALNNLLPRIHAKMTIPEVETVLSAAYPNVKGQMGTWDGSTGYIDYKLDDHFGISISSMDDVDGKKVVHENLLFYIHNHDEKHRIDIKSYFYESPSQKKTKFLD